jgi:hypothetical protein
MIECFAICIVLLILCVEVHLIFLICIAIFICSLLAESITIRSKTIVA